jgi:LEA14-like dessication related protein
MIRRSVPAAARGRLASTLCLAVLLAGCASLRDLEPPEVRLISLRPVAGTLMEQQFEVGLAVLNPNNRDIDVDGMDFELEVNGKRLARGVSAEGFTLPRLGETRATVLVTTSTLSVLRQAMSLSTAGTIDYRLLGKVHLGGLGGTLKFDESGEISLEDVASSTTL